MPTNNEIAVMRRRLRGALRRGRRNARLSQQQAADAMEWSLSKLVRLEAGSGRPIASDVIALLTYYGATPEDIREFSDIARELPRRSIQDDEILRSLYQPAYLKYLEFEQASQLVRQWHPTLVPGMLQTEQYAHEILTKAFNRQSRDAQKIIDARLERQELITVPGGPRFHFIIDEAILLRPVGTPRVMREQITKVMELSELHVDGARRVEIQVLPLSIGPHPGMRGPFILLEFEDDEDEDVLFMETPRGDYFTRDDPETTSQYQVIFGFLEKKSLKDEGLTTRAESLLRQIDAHA